MQTLRRPKVVDPVLAGMLAALALWDVAQDSGPFRDRVVLAAASLLMTVPLAWRRRHPILVLTVGMLALGASAVVTEAPESIGTLLATLVAVYSVAEYTELEPA